MWPWPLTYIEKGFFAWHYYMLGKQVCEVFLKSIDKYRSYARNKGSQNIWPSIVTLTLGISKQTFHMTLVLFKENKYAMLFWNPLINIELKLRTKSILTFDLQLWPWPWKHIKTNFSHDTNTCLEEHVCKITLKSIDKCRSYAPDDLQLWPWP